MTSIVTFYTLQAIKEKASKYNVSRKISAPLDMAVFIREVTHLQDKAEEYLYMITLDTKNMVTGVFEVSHGSLNASVVHPREILKRAIVMNAASIIISHNHPSGDTEPSQEDINITRRMYECCKIIGIDLLDHVIIGDRYTSLKEKGIL